MVPARSLLAGFLLVGSCGKGGLGITARQDAGPADSARDAPRSLGLGQCRWDRDCEQNGSCVAPGGDRPCGICMQITTCTSDSQCQADGGTLVCGPSPPCSCPYGDKTCIPPCTDNAACKEGEICSGGHCIETPCQSDADCPVDFQCTAGSCGRNGCSTDVDCSGYCVGGDCYSTPGTCYGPVALAKGSAAWLPGDGIAAA